MALIIRREKWQKGYVNVIRTQNGRLLTSEKWNAYEGTTQNFKQRHFKNGKVILKAPKGYTTLATELKNVIEQATFKDQSKLISMQRAKQGTQDTFDAILSAKESLSRKPRGRYQYVVKLRLKRGKGDGEGSVHGRSRMSPLSDGRILSHSEMRFEAWENALGRLNNRLNKTTGTDINEGRLLLDEYISSFQEGYVRYTKS